MLRSQESSESLSVVLGREHHLGRVTEDLYGVFRPCLRVVVVAEIPHRLNADVSLTNVDLSKPTGAQLPGNDLILAPADQHVQVIHLGGRDLDQLLVPLMWWIELPDHQAAFHTPTPRST